ncbi:hypothetical protein AGMMS49975_24130 [Clostridia bacterium]|nr:hypothetical protein AGMMS49975_24130 [Clostridia bacterium]
MIYTSRFYNPELKTGKYTTVRVSLGSPRWNVGYTIDGAINELMPKGLFGNYDDDRPGFEREYRKLLERVGVDRIMNQLCGYSNQGKDVVLLCYEDIRKGENDWCHRVMFADWWKEKTGEIIEELFDPTTPKIDKPKKVAVAPTVKAEPIQEESAPVQMSLFNFA